MRRFQIGDQVMLLPHMTEATSKSDWYTYMDFDMDKLKGRVLTIQDFEMGSGYLLEECPTGYAYDDSWLESAVPENLTEARAEGQITDEQYLDYLLRGAN